MIGWPPPPGSPRRPRGGGCTLPGRYVMTCLRLLRRWAAGRSVWNMCGPSAVPAGCWVRTTPVSRPRWPGSQPSTPPRIYAPSWKVIIQQYRPEVHDDLAEHDRARRRVDLSPGLDNTWILNGLLDAATGEALAAAFDVYAAPTGPDDTRSPGQRRADALAEIAGRAADTTDRPTGTGHVTITVTPTNSTQGLGVRWPLRGCSCRGWRSPNTPAPPGLPGRGAHDRSGPLAAPGRQFAQRYATKAQRAALAVLRR